VRYEISCMASSSNQFAFVALNLADKFYALSRNLGRLRSERIGNFSRLCLPRGTFGAINSESFQRRLTPTWIHASIICCLPPRFSEHFFPAPRLELSPFQCRLWRRAWAPICSASLGRSCRISFRTSGYR